MTQTQFFTDYIQEARQLFETSFTPKGDFPTIEHDLNQPENFVKWQTIRRFNQLKENVEKIKPLSIQFKNVEIHQIDNEQLLITMICDTKEKEVSENPFQLDIKMNHSLKNDFYNKKSFYIALQYAVTNAVKQSFIENSKKVEKGES